MRGKLSRRDYSFKVNLRNTLVPIAVFLACLTPRFIGFMKINIGFYVSFYSLFVIGCTFLFFNAYGRSKKIARYNGHIQFERGFLFVLFAVTIVSCFRALNLVAWAQYVYYIGISLLMLYLLNISSSKKLFSAIFYAISIAVSIVVIMGFYEVITGGYIFEVGGFSRRLYGKVPVFIFYNPNDYAMFVATLLPIVVYCALYSQRVFVKAAFWVILAIAVYLQCILLSRAVMLSLIFVAIMLILVLLKSRKSRAYVLLISIAFLLAVFLVPPVNELLTNFVIRNSIDAQSTSDYYRINLLRNGIEFLKQTYGFGVGPGNLKIWLASRSVYHIGELEYIHNWYAEILVTFGVLIFVLYAVFHTKILYKLYKTIGIYALRGKSIALLSSFVVFSITSISSSSNIYSEWVWMYLALIVSYISFCYNTVLPLMTIRYKKLRKLREKAFLNNKGQDQRHLAE